MISGAHKSSPHDFAYRKSIRHDFWRPQIMC